MSSVSSRFRLFPLVALTAGALFFVKINSVFVDVSAGGRSAAAGESGEATDDKGESDHANALGSEVQDPINAEALIGESDHAADHQDTAVVDPALMTRSELDLLQDLAGRRSELDRRADEIAIREGLLETTERRIDEKIARLESLEGRIKSLLVQHEEQENEELKSIVKVYETMKAKDAARIFERLDMKIQLEVATRMKESKMAPILAAMTPDAAKSLTVELATRARLPDIEG